MNIIEIFFKKQHFYFLVKKTRFHFRFMTLVHFEKVPHMPHTLIPAILLSYLRILLLPGILAWGRGDLNMTTYIYTEKVARTPNFQCSRHQQVVES